MELSKTLEGKLNSISSLLQGKKVIVAFSGGVDSSLLAYLSNKYAKETLLVTEKSVLYPEEEIEITRQFAKKFNIPHVVIERDPLEDKDFQCNPKNRCYICKKGLYGDIKQIQNEKNFNLILDGSNQDDLSDYRPGMKALEELGITTPYINFKITKLEIRNISKYFDLEVQSKPSMACFSSRIPYEQEITIDKLDRIREGEKYLKQTFGLNQLRVRHHEGALARIELLKEDLAQILTEENLKLIRERFRELGFLYITIDIDGFRSGSMNEVL